VAERIPVCDVCDAEMIRFGGTWICPTAGADLTDEDEALVLDALEKGRGNLS
jgi:hypothetical protein